MSSMFQAFERAERAALAIVLASSVAAAAGVNILDKPQLGTFATIQGAVDAADHGDVLLVDPGIYTGFTIDNKALLVLGMPGGIAQVNGMTKVINLAANHNVSLIGMSLLAVDNQFQKLNGLELTNDLGNVRVQNCVLKSSRYTVGFSGPWLVGQAASVTSSTRVIFAQCTLTGRDVGFNSGEQLSPGGDALRSIDSSIALYDCTLKGGRGSDETQPGGGDGGAACRVTNYGVYASGTKFTGGRGGGGDYLGCTFAGNGGDALVLASAQAQLLDDTLIAGSGDGYYTCTPGVDGQQIANNGGVVNTLTGVRRKLSVASVATDNALLQLTFNGQPGDRVRLLFGKKPAFLFVTSMNGVVAIPSPWFQRMLPIGTIPPSGTLIFQYPIGDLQGASAGWIWNVQGWCINAHAQYVTTPMQIFIRNT